MIDICGTLGLDLFVCAGQSLSWSLIFSHIIELHRWSEMRGFD